MKKYTVNKLHAFRKNWMVEYPALIKRNLRISPYLIWVQSRERFMFPCNAAISVPIWFLLCPVIHYSDVTMDTMASQITSLTIVYLTFYSGADQRKHQSSASQAFVRGIHRGPVNSPHKWPVTRKIFPFDDVTMICADHGGTCWFMVPRAHYGVS